MSNVPEPLAYSIRNCATALQVSERTIRRAIVAGKLQVIRLGRLVRVPAESLRQFIEGEQASGPVRPFIRSDRYKSDERRHTKSKPELNAAKGKTHVGSNSEENSHGPHHEAL